MLFVTIGLIIAGFFHVCASVGVIVVLTVIFGAEMWGWRGKGLAERVSWSSRALKTIGE